MGKGRTDTLVSQCILRAAALVVADDVESGRRKSDDRASRWDVLRAGVKATHRAAHVAALITMWAVALEDLDRPEIGVEEYQRWASESRATVYRHMAEFRALWPEYESPNELARLVLDAARQSGQKPSPSLVVSVA